MTNYITMAQPHKNNTLQEDSDLKKVLELFKRNYKLFVISILTTLILAFFLNRYKIPKYQISSSILIKEETRPQGGGDVNNYLNSNLFGVNQNFQNELWVLRSAPVIEQTVKNLDLMVEYYQKGGFQYHDAYQSLPFQVQLLQDHVQPVNVRFNIAIQDKENFRIQVKSGRTTFRNLFSDENAYEKENWSFEHLGKFGQLIESPDMAFIVQLAPFNIGTYYREEFIYSFILRDVSSTTESLKNSLECSIIDRNATIIEISYESSSIKKGKNIVNELMEVYSTQNLNRKNHIAAITIDYIEMQLDEISDSLSLTEDNLQSFRSSNQLLDITDQATGLSTQYLDLQNQMAELVTRKRYYDYVAEYLETTNDFSNMIVPASMGIQDQLLNNLMSELISAQAQRANLIENRQEQNPLVERLTIQIENLRSTISENISAVQKTTEISIDEMDKRISRVESQISRLPVTQRQLGGIERQYRLNDAIYNYLLQKRAEAKITQASNLPDNIIIEPAKMVGTNPVSPNKKKNYFIALFLGIGIPFGYLTLKSALNNKIETQENIERLTEIPVLGIILHNRRKSSNVLMDYPASSIAESYRALRTNLDFRFKAIAPKVFLITSCIEGEGKTFNALNLAMSYAQLGRRTILMSFDLRKPTDYFSENGGSLVGLSSYFTGRVGTEEIIIKSPHSKLDFIPSGPVPPNPVELLAHDDTKELINKLRDYYDCIILDSTPLAQVSDGYLLMDYADVKVIIARCNYTIKKVFSLIMKDLVQKNIHNICIVLNDNRIRYDQYGYGYGYYEKKKR